MILACSYTTRLIPPPLLNQVAVLSSCSGAPEAAFISYFNRSICISTLSSSSVLLSNSCCFPAEQSLFSPEADGSLHSLPASILTPTHSRLSCSLPHRVNRRQQSHLPPPEIASAYSNGEPCSSCVPSSCHPASHTPLVFPHPLTCHPGIAPKASSSISVYPGCCNSASSPSVLNNKHLFPHTFGY